MSPIEEARAALIQRDDFEAGRAPAALTWPGWVHLRAALAEADRLTAERDAYRAFAVRLGERFAAPDTEDMIARHLDPGDLNDIAESILLRVDESEAMIDREVMDRLSGPRRENARLMAEINRLRAAYADLPPEPEPSPMAAFLAVLAIDNHPDDADGGGDCDGLR